MKVVVLVVITDDAMGEVNVTIMDGAGGGRWGISRHRDFVDIEAGGWSSMAVAETGVGVVTVGPHCDRTGVIIVVVDGYWITISDSGHVVNCSPSAKASFRPEANNPLHSFPVHIQK